MPPWPALRPYITTATYPLVDGSTSTLPLARVIASEIFGLKYHWQPGLGFEGEAEIVPYAVDLDDLPLVEWVMTHIVHNKTHQAYLNLVDRTVDLIMVANPPSPDESAYATASNVTLEWSPIALDALVIIVNQANPVTKLSTAQIRGIFMGQITNWSEVGGPDQPIHPYVRPENSGSQQLMNTVVMNGLTMPPWPEDRKPAFMGALIDAIETDPWAIGYSVYYYVTYQTPKTGYSIIKVDGIAPTASSIKGGSYPFVTEVWVVKRTDLDPKGIACWMHNWLLAPFGQTIVARSGYVPLPTDTP